MIALKRIKKAFFVSLVMIFVFLSANIYGQQTEIRMQSVFLYNFTRLISWPSDYQSGDFIMAVYGNSPIFEELQDMANTKRVGSQKILARNYNSISDISKCHIIYVPSNQSRSISDIVSALKSKGIKALVVGNSRNAIRNGAIVNFVLVDGRQRFEISQSNAKALGVTLGGEITRLGIVVD